MTDRPDDLMALADLQQMCHAPGDGFSAGAWCEATNDAVGPAALEAAQKERAAIERSRSEIVRTARHEQIRANAAEARVRQLEEALTRIDAVKDIRGRGLTVARMIAREVLAAKENTSVPYPASEQIRHLADATEHLFEVHGCNHHGWETWCAALDAAKENTTP